MRILGIDPSSTFVGYALLDSHPSFSAISQLLAAGDFQLQGQLPGKCRAAQEAVRELIRRHNPEALAIESSVWLFPAATLPQAHVRGAILSAAAEFDGLKVLDIPPTVAKKAATGKGSAKKADVESAVRLVYNLQPGVLSEHAADAVAIAMAAWADLTQPARRVRRTYKRKSKKRGATA